MKQLACNPDPAAGIWLDYIEAALCLQSMAPQEGEARGKEF